LKVLKFFLVNYKELFLEHKKKLKYLFKIKNSLLYYVKTITRLYILDSIYKEIISIVYNKYYFSIKRTFYKLDNFYILCFKKRFEIYIKYYFIYNINIT